MAGRGVLREVRSEPENDENLPVNPGNIQDRPTDDDRARFGFKPKMVKTVAPVGSGPPEPHATPTERLPVLDLQTLLRRTLGDPDEVLPVLRLKPTAGKYDFKDKIQDLQAMIGPLKNALSDQRLKAKALVDALLSMESGIEQKLQSSMDEVTGLQSALNEVTGQLTLAQRELQQLRQELPQLRQAAEQSKRLEEHSETLERELSEARRIARSFSEDASKYKRRCEEMVEKHRTQMEEAAELLRRQVNETIEAQQHLTDAHQKKEVSLRAEFEKGKEELKKEHKHQLEEFKQTLRTQEAEARAKMDTLKEQHQKILQEKEADASASLQAMKDRYEKMLKEKILLLEEKISLLKNKEEQMVSSQQQLQEAQLAELQEKEAQMQLEMDRKDEETKTRLQELQKSHQRKESEMQLEMSRKEQSHQQQLEEMRKSHELKAGSLRNDLSSLQGQLKEKEGTLRETIQSLQLLQNSSSDQLRFEQQRVQKLETEVEDLRNRSVAQLQKLEHAEVELGTTRQQVSDLRQALQRLENEKELQSERASERQATLQEQIIKLNLRSKASEEEALKLKETLEVRQAQCEKLTSQRDGLEVEFKSYKEHHGTSNQQQMEAITELKLTVDKLSKQVDNTKAELHLQQGNLSQRQGYIISLENQLAQAELTRRELHNIIQELKGNIRVFCRVRPALSASDVALQSAENKITLEHLTETYNFNFDRVFEPLATQEAIFDEVSGLVQSALDGYKVCIFAYGQTGSGKTFTMQGEPGVASGGRGLIPRCLSKILQCSEAMRAAGWEWTLKVSFLEVYNEVLRDLLDSEGHNLVHVIKHDEAYGTMVTNVTSVEVKQMDHIQRLMEKAAKARAVGSTEMNATSSRSHSIFAMYLHGVNRELNCELTGALHLVDLAGSERLEKSGSTGDRLKETQNINKSLSSLADVFMAKAEGRSHIPFRNSKLTHLMEPCLNGQGKTLMVVNVGPEAEHAHESLCSLRFASQVSQCNTGGKPKRCVRPARANAASGAGRQAGAEKTARRK